jgi:hypothetical protein
MNIQQTRFLSVIILLIIVITNQYQILNYLPIMVISLEYLNRNKIYLTTYNYKLLNSIFIGYVLFICLDRGRPFEFTVLIEMIFNSIEHMLFGFVICLKASVYYSILKKKQTLSITELIKIVLVFNVFGFFNEFFQNWYKNQEIWLLTFDSKKDILMNIIGSVIFILMYQKIQKNIFKDSIKDI